jgi:hypothetical protein
MHGGEVSTVGRLHPSGRWVSFRLQVAEFESLWMVLDTGAPLSALSPGVALDLTRRGLLLSSGRPNLHRLTDLSIGGQRVADLEVGVVRRLERLQIEGLLGLDFLGLFEDIHFNVPSLHLRLVPPGH